MILASAWWVKSLIPIGAALAYDLRRRLVVPATALTVALAFGISAALSSTTKEIVDRERPQTGALVDLPTTASFPSGHATTAFAACVALGLLVPALRWWALALAAVVAYSRVHLGVHFWTDVLAGAVLGTLVALAVVRSARRYGLTPRR